MVNSNFNRFIKRYLFSPKARAIFILIAAALAIWKSLTGELGEYVAKTLSILGNYIGNFFDVITFGKVSPLLHKVADKIFGFLNYIFNNPILQIICGVLSIYVIFKNLDAIISRFKQKQIIISAVTLVYYLFYIRAGMHNLAITICILLIHFQTDERLKSFLSHTINKFKKIFNIKIEEEIDDELNDDNTNNKL